MEGKQRKDNISKETKRKEELEEKVEETKMKREKRKRKGEKRKGEKRGKKRKSGAATTVTTAVNWKAAGLVVGWLVSGRQS